MAGGALGCWSWASSCWRRERPDSHQRVTSDSRLSRVNRLKRVASEASTVRITPRRVAPPVVLLVRAPLRISASRRASRSLRLFHEHEQAVRVVHQLVLQADEVGHLRRGLIRNDPFAVARAKCAESGEQPGHLRRAADAQPGIALVTPCLVVRLAQIVER